MNLLRIRIRERTRFHDFRHRCGDRAPVGRGDAALGRCSVVRSFRPGHLTPRPARDGEMPVPEIHAPVVDVAFSVEGTSVPADHDWPLLRAVEGRLPWFAAEALAGIHPLRTVQTSYGIALLAQRAKLVLRLPAARLPDALRLQDAAFDVGGSALRVGKGNARTLRPSATLSAHRVATDTGDDAAFEADVARSLQRMGIDCGFISGRRRQGIAGGRENRRVRADAAWPGRGRLVAHPMRGSGRGPSAGLGNLRSGEGNRRNTGMNRGRGTPGAEHLKSTEACDGIYGQWRRTCDRRRRLPARTRLPG